MACRLCSLCRAPEGKSMYESFGNWNFDNVYIDERASDDQRTSAYMRQPKSVLDSMVPT
jgi:hypothetical protein